MRAVVVAALLVLAAAPAEAARRYAIVIGANHGGALHEPLRFAETDAERMAAVLRDVGGFAPSDVVLLTRTDADAVRQALIEMNARIRAEGGPTMLFVFYSGHGDAQALHLAGTRLDLGELKNLVTGSPARSRVLVVDSCQSGAITRVKGGTPAPAFDIVFEGGMAEGVAILSSSAASEDAQESDALGASIFTHHLVSALLGAADRDGDGAITLGEAFSYSSERTLAVSSSTRLGPQHPTYRFDLGGRDDLVLSRPGAGRHMGLLVLPEEGVWLVRETNARGAVVAEVVTDAPGARLALRPGRYAILRRGRDHLLEGEIAVANAQTTALRTRDLRRIEYAQAVRKGGTDRDHSLTFHALGVTRTPIFDLGPTGGAGMGVRFDFPSLSVEGRFLFSQGQRVNERLRIKTNELLFTTLVTHSIDWGLFTMGGGFEVGGLRFLQSFDSPRHASRASYGLLVGPLAYMERMLIGGISLRLEGAIDTYLLKGQEGMQTPIAPRAALGVGVSL